MNIQFSKEVNKQARRKFPRLHINYPTKPNVIFQADLVSLQADTLGHNHILVVIDLYSRYGWAVPLKSATSSEVQSAWTKHIKVVPKMLHTDRGSEFVGSSFKTFLQDKKVKHYFTENYDIKACVAERFVRTLRKLFEEYRVLHNFPVQWKWSAHLPKIVKQYNDRTHSGIRSVPSDVYLKEQSPPEPCDLALKRNETCYYNGKMTLPLGTMCE